MVPSWRTYQCPCCIAPVEVHNSSEVIVQRDIDVKPTDNAVQELAKLLRRFWLSRTVCQSEKDHYRIWPRPCPLDHAGDHS